jgi:hypothetical protein
VLGKNEKGKASLMISLGVLMSNRLPERQADIVELPAPELDIE